MSTTTMKALVANGSVPLYREDYPVPVAPEGFVTVQVKAAALTNLTKMRASGKHYSVEGSSDASAQPPVVGVDGVGVDRATGRRVYFAMPDAPNGGMAELCVVSKKRCIPVPDELDDVTAAAIANPGMSVWAGLVHRAKIQPGEIILINGATGTAGALAVQIAKVLGAKKVIATGRNASELQALVALGADVTIPLPSGSAESPQELKEQFDRFEYQVIQQLKEEGAIDIVLDYLWGDSAASIITAVAKGIEDAHPVRFVQVGTASGQDTIPLAGAALRSSAIQLMGSGLKSIPMPQLIGSIVDVFNAFVAHKLVFSQVVVPLSEAPTYWNQTKPRVVFTP